MADKENCVRITRGMKRRTAVAGGLDTAPPLPQRKKRVVLGEISSNTTSATKLQPAASKGKSKQKKKKKGVVKTQALEKDEKVACSQKRNDDPRMCADYASDIYDYLKHMEVDTGKRVVLDYMEKIQKHLSAEMRGILVDWLVEVSQEYKLLAASLYLAVSYVDRYLSFNVVARNELQILGVGSMLVAS